MTRLKMSSGQFGLIGGICRESSDCILAEEPSALSSAGRWKGSLYILAEPVVEGGRGYQVARQIIAEIAQAYYACTSPSVTTCLARAIRKANLGLFQHNMQVSGHEKVTVGVTCAVVHRDELFLAQVLPGQAYAVHKGRIKAFPLNPSWDPEATTVPTMARLLAVGWSETVSPEFFHSPLDSGDVFCLCSSNIGRFLGHEEAEQVLLYQEPADVIEQLYRRVHQQGFSEAHAIVVEVQPAMSRQAGSLFSLPGLQERARLAGESLAGWGSMLAGEARRIFQRPKKPRPRHVRVPRPRPKPEPKPETAPLVRPKPPEPWWVTLQQKVYGLFHPEARYPRLERPRLRIKPAPKRRNIVPYLLAAAAVIVLGIVVTLIVVGLREQEDSRVNLLLEQTREQIDNARQIAQSEQAGDITRANTILKQAEEDLLQALSPGSPNPQVELLLQDLRDERDRINDVTRFEEVELLVDLNTLSTTMAMQGFTAGCSNECLLRDVAVVNEAIYLLEDTKGTIYLYSPASNQVSPFLWEGMELRLEGRTYEVGTILDIAPLTRVPETGPTENWLAVIDADRWLYLNRGDQWEIYILVGDDTWEGRAVDLEGYDGFVYVLRGMANNILKYYREAFLLEPIIWIERPAQVRLTDAIDMVIDGYIHLLLKDGTVQVLAHGKLDHELTYDVYPSTVVANQVFVDLEDLESPYVYVADRYGRIIQLRKEGEPAFVRQLWGPEDGDLRNLRAAVVREQEGLFYLAVGSTLCRGILPSLIPDLSPEASPLPEPSPLPTP